MAPLVGVWGITGHGGAGHWLSAMGDIRGASSVLSWYASRGSGSGVHARPLGLGTDALRASTVIAGIPRSSLRASDVCSAWLCVCVHPCCTVQSSGSVRAEKVCTLCRVSDLFLSLLTSSVVRFSVFANLPLHHCC